jgi:hypothetical protein
MSQDVLDDWIASLSTHSNREIAKLVHVAQDRVRALRAAQAEHTRILHQMGHPTKVHPLHYMGIGRQASVPDILSLRVACMTSTGSLKFLAFH